MSRLFTFLLFVLSASASFSQVDCAGVDNGSALVDDCGDCLQAYLYNYVTHAVTFIDVVVDVEAGPNEMIVLADSPSNAYWNASCTSVLGCTDTTACNFNYQATEDDGTCGSVDDCGECHIPYCYNMTTHEVSFVSLADCSEVWISGTGGGMSNLDNAYSPVWNASCTDCAGVVNGSALVDDCEDCLQAYLYNYVTHAVTYIDVVADAVAGDNEMIVLADSPGNAYWNASCTSVLGCTDTTACSFNYQATEDDGTCGSVDDCGECHIPYCYNMTTHEVSFVSLADCSEVWISGTGGGMSNLDNAYSPVWNVSCSLEGCTYSNACNYSAIANLDNGSCEWLSCVIEGCVYEDAENFHPEATQDDGSCIFSESSCPADLNQDGTVATSDLLLFLADFGTYCE
jgi:hypothetical protein